MIKIVLDTNTLISALGWKDGSPRKVFDLCLEGDFVLTTSKDIIEEFAEVITRPKFSFLTEQEKNEFILLLLQVCKIVEPKQKITVIRDDPSDNIILEAAIGGKVDFIVSGDNHLLNLKEFKGIKIIKPKEFLDLMR